MLFFTVPRQLESREAHYAPDVYILSRERAKV
jgi:hypothetical protein